MPFHLFSPHYFYYLLKRRANQFFISIAIRKLALGMVVIFEPIYLYLYFGNSLPLTLLYFGAIFGIYGLLAVYGGKIMAKIGLKHSILYSHFFYFGYYLTLFFLNLHFLLIPLAIILRGLGRTLFWPPFHTDFVRFSQQDHRGKEVGKLNIASFGPVIVAPILGGIILGTFGYKVLFLVILVVLLTSAVPLFLSEETHEVYTDSYEKAWGRIFRKKNRKSTLAFATYAMESGIGRFLWPLFMFIIAIGYEAMGGIGSFALAISVIFAYYLGRITDTMRRSKLLDIGSGLTSLAWVIKIFVATPFDALLARAFYRICRTSAAVPYKTIFYDKADLKGPKADEFIIYRAIVVNISRLFLFMILAGIFVVVPNIKIAFVSAAVLSLGFMFLGKLPDFKELLS